MFPVILSIFFILAYFFYNHYLRVTYGSIFLNHLLPAANFEEASEIIKTIYKNWGTQYLSIIHYGILVAVWAAFIFFNVRNKITLKKIQLQLWILLLALCNGCILFAICMLVQFSYHDYYFLDTFFLPVILFLILSISNIPKLNFKYPRMAHGFILILCISLVVNAIISQTNRRKTNPLDKITGTVNNFKDSDTFLDSLNISKNARMLVIDANAPNIPFIRMKRKGYAIIYTEKEVIQNALNWKYDYIVVQNDFFISGTYAYPEIVAKMNRVADNGKISICTLKKDKKPQNLIEFFGLDKTIPVFESTITFDTIPDDHWQNTYSTTDHFRPDNKAGYLQADTEFGLTYKYNDMKALKEKGRILSISAGFLKDTIQDCKMIISVKDNGQRLYYKSCNLKEFLKKKGTWEKMNLLFQLPRIENDHNELAVYLWNYGKDNLYYDDFTVRIY
jgi:hypothetical protein